MTEIEWVTESDPFVLLEFLKNKVSDRKDRLYYCAGCYQIRHLFHDPESSMKAVIAGEKMADGTATLEEVGEASLSAECPTFGYDFDRSFLIHFPEAYQIQLARRLVELGALPATVLSGGEWVVNHEIRDRLLTAATLAEDCINDQSILKKCSRLGNGVFDRLKAVNWPGRWLVDCVFGNPFRPVFVDTSWRSSAVCLIARQMYESRDFSSMSVLADALLDAGCDEADILRHCRGNEPHVRGCWVVDLLLGKE